MGFDSPRHFQLLLKINSDSIFVMGKYIDEILKPGNLISPFVVSIHAILWGAWVLFPSTTFATPAYDGLAALGPEWAWGIGVILVGVYSLYSALKLSDSGISRAFGLLFLLWLFVAVSFSVAGLASTAVPTYFMISFFMGLNYISVKKNKEERDYVEERKSRSPHWYRRLEPDEK